MRRYAKIDEQEDAKINSSEAARRAGARDPVSCCAAVLLSLGLCVLGTDYGAEDVLDSEEPERLFDGAAQAARDGDFKLAWSALIRGYALMRDSPAARETIEATCRHGECPSIGKLAWILGKTRSDLAFLDELCGEVADGCPQPVKDGQSAKAYLGKQGAVAPGPHEAEIRFTLGTQGDSLPLTQIDIGGKVLWGLINTGSYIVEFSAQSDIITQADYSTFGEPLVPRPGADETVPIYRRAVLGEFRLGSWTEARIPAIAREGSLDYVVIGMNALLRYRQVCFSWADATLYLGRLGPCSGGEQPFTAALTATRGEPVIEIPAGDGALFRAVVYTGARETYCREPFARRTDNGGFQFGGHPELTAQCREDPPAGADSRWDAAIAMDALTKFDAFGWELNPFRMYFVPKQPRDESSRASATRDGGGALAERRLEKLMDTTMRTAGEGDFEATWESYSRIHVLMRTSNRARTVHSAYCPRPARCPDIGQIAWIIGKTKADLAFLDGRCHDETDGGCAQWLERVRLLKGYLNDKPANATHPAHELEVEFIHADLDDLRPWTIVQIGGKPMWAMMDTGAVWARFPTRSSILTQADHQTYGEPRAMEEADGIVREQQDAVLRDFTLGLVTEDRVPSKAWHPKGDSVTIGMNALLRYPQVCFSWSDATLHLGSLGPCAGGEMPFSAHLSPQGQPFVEVGIGDGEPLRALVDTGVAKTDCQDRFMRRMGDGAFRFGRHPGLVAGCGAASPSLLTAGWIDAVIGMDDLSRFDAFGWELNPFRMYFVPKQPGSASDALEPTDKPSDAQPKPGEVQ